MNAFEQGKRNLKKQREITNGSQPIRKAGRINAHGATARAESRSRWEKKNSRICLSSQSRKNILIG